MQCAERLRVQAYFDGEVDALAAAEIERHTAHCAECRALLEDLEQCRVRIRRDLEYGAAPRELRERIMQLLAGETAAAAPAAPAMARPWRTPPFWRGAIGGFGTALAAALALFPLWPSPPDALLDELVAAHVRSLMPAHLTDVLSTDQHTVKPWFAGHADVSPAVADFTAQGYRLVGGRADYLDHRRTAAVVYAHGAHIINVFTLAAGGHAFPGAASRSGYHIVCWRAGDLGYCAVSDAGWDELQALARLLQGVGAREER